MITRYYRGVEPEIRDEAVVRIQSATKNKMQIKAPAKIRSKNSRIDVNFVDRQGNSVNHIVIK